MCVDHVEVILAQPRGFCAGVERAVSILDAVVDKYIALRSVYVLHEIVHNSYVVESFCKKGVRFVDSVDEVPDGAVLVFSAHGVAKRVRACAEKKDLLVIDATCPLVTKVHTEIGRYNRNGYQIVLIGHKGHVEVEGSVGQIDNAVQVIQNVDDVWNIKVNDPHKLAYVTQTTLSVVDTRVIVDELKTRFPSIVGPDLRDICYATQNRQNAVKHLSSLVDVVLVVGGKNSSNTNRLVDIAKAQNNNSFLIGSHEDINMDWLSGARKVGITAGASAPDSVVRKLLGYLSSNLNIKISTMDGVKENVVFKLPELPELHSDCAS